MLTNIKETDDGVFDWMIMLDKKRRQKELSSSNLKNQKSEAAVNKPEQNQTFSQRNEQKPLVAEVPRKKPNCFQRFFCCRN